MALESSVETKQYVCKRAFLYVFLCDSTSLTENSWSVPKKGKRERKGKKKGGGGEKTEVVS